MPCITDINKDLLFDCDNLPSAGIEKNVLLVNRQDINYTTSPVTGGVVDVNLKPGTEGFMIEGIKQINSYNYEVTVNTDSLNRVTHSFIGRIYDLSPENKAQINAFVNGANVVAIVENLAKGADQLNAFEVLGFENGLEISEGAKNSLENDGAFVLTLSSNEQTLESKVPLTFLDTDFATTKTKFENKLEEPA